MLVVVHSVSRLDVNSKATALSVNHNNGPNCSLFLCLVISSKGFKDVL